MELKSIKQMQMDHVDPLLIEPYGIEIQMSLRA